MKHASACNPNRVQWSAPSAGQPGWFSLVDGATLFADRVMELDAINPQVASPDWPPDRWSNWPNPTAARHSKLSPAAAKSGLSKDTHEVITRAPA
jgi:hypothetical protein